MPARSRLTASLLAHAMLAPAVLVFAMLPLVVLPAAAQQIQISRDNRTIAVTASDDAEATADTAVVAIGFRTYGKDQDSTYADASRTSNAILAALTTAKVPKEAIESATQSLSPIEPNGDTKSRYAQGLRFEFMQQWRVTVPATDAAAVLHTAITAGANESGNIEWKLADDNALDADAARKALERAKQIASRMAAGLGVRLGGLVYASNEAPPRVLPQFKFGAATAAAALGRGVSPIALAPQKISRSATVYAVFAID